MCGCVVVLCGRWLWCYWLLFQTYDVVCVHMQLFTPHYWNDSCYWLVLTTVLLLLLLMSTAIVTGSWWCWWRRYICYYCDCGDEHTIDWWPGAHPSPTTKPVTKRNSGIAPSKQRQHIPKRQLLLTDNQQQNVQHGLTSPVFGWLTLPVIGGICCYYVVSGIWVPLRLIDLLLLIVVVIVVVGCCCWCCWHDAWYCCYWWWWWWHWRFYSLRVRYFTILLTPVVGPFTVWWQQCVHCWLLHLVLWCGWYLLIVIVIVVGVVVTLLLVLFGELLLLLYGWNEHVFVIVKCWKLLLVDKLLYYLCNC